MRTLLPGVHKLSRTKRNEIQLLHLQMFKIEPTMRQTGKSKSQKKSQRCHPRNNNLRQLHIHYRQEGAPKVKVTTMTKTVLHLQRDFLISRYHGTPIHLQHVKWPLAEPVSTHTTFKLILINVYLLQNNNFKLPGLLKQNKPKISCLK